jgi:hypothetical protein
VYVEKIKVKVYVNQGKSLSHACIDDALSPQLNLTVDPTLQKQRYSQKIIANEKLSKGQEY